MAGSEQDVAPRNAPEAGVADEWWGVLRAEDVIGGSPTGAPAGTDLRFGQDIRVSAPLGLIKVAAQTSTITRDYPYDGDGVLDAVNNATPSVTLDATGVPATADYTGLIVVVMSGTAGAVGEVRRIVSYVAATRVATLNRAYATPPVAGDTYRVLVPCLFRADAVVKGEYSSATARAVVIVAFYDFPRTKAGTPALRAPQRYWDVARDLDNLHNSGSTATSLVDAARIDMGQGASYYNARTLVVPAQGALGFKAHLISLDVGDISLWAGAA